ncbi:MAG: hypothetical protein JRF48_02305 [Deltaproteobacteria bacterium]|nr:hypothetical protein [Deltaproteobacteria bacterium]
MPNDRSFPARLLESRARHRLAFLQVIDVDLGDSRIEGEGNLHTPRPHPRQQITYEEDPD